MGLLRLQCRIPRTLLCSTYLVTLVMGGMIAPSRVMEEAQQESTCILSKYKHTG